MGMSLGEDVVTFLWALNCQPMRELKLKGDKGEGGSCCQWQQEWVWKLLVRQMLQRAGLGLWAVLPITHRPTECTRDRAWAPAAALTFEEVVSATLLLKGFATAFWGCGCYRDAVRDEQENLVVDGHLLCLFEVLHGAFAWDVCGNKTTCGG